MLNLLAIGWTPSYWIEYFRRDEAIIELSLKEAKIGFTLSVRNKSSSKVSVSTHVNAWIVHVVDREGRPVSSFENYLKGGNVKGTIFYPPNILVPLPSDWVALPSGATLTFHVDAYNTGGILRTLPRHYTAWVETNFISLLDSAPSWVTNGMFRVPSRIDSKRLQRGVKSSGED